MPRGGVRKGKKKETKVGRGPFEQCVGDLCSVPRGGVRKKKSVGDRLGSMSGTSTLCHEAA